MQPWFTKSIWLAPPRLAFFLAICGVGHPLTTIIWFNKVVVVVTVYLFDNGHPCYDQLTPAKTRYLLTSIA